MTRPTKIIAAGLLLALVIELITVVLRFGLELDASRDTQFLCALTCGVRIHHCYVGLLLIGLSLFLKHRARDLVLVGGIGLLLSDLVHHFVILQAALGDHQFQLLYPR